MIACFARQFHATLSFWIILPIVLFGFYSRDEIPLKTKFCLPNMLLHLVSPKEASGAPMHAQAVALCKRYCVLMPEEVNVRHITSVCQPSYWNTIQIRRIILRAQQLSQGSV